MLTKACKSRESTLDLTLPCTDYILALFEHYKDEYKDNPIFAMMFNSDQKKIDKYYKLLDKTLANIVAIVLYPRRKQKQIEKYQKAEQVMLVKEQVKTFQETKYKLLIALITSLFAQLPSTSLIKALNEFLKQLANNEDKDLIVDEYARYCTQP